MIKIGRPTKKNAVKPGQLKKGLVRFTFITTKELIRKVKNIAKSQNRTIKDIMTELLETVDGNWPKNEKNKSRVNEKNEVKLLEYMRKNK